MFRSNFASFLNLSARVGQLFGVPIKLHITIIFFLLPVFTARGIGFVYALEVAVAVVISILLHELGHALSAKHYGMRGLSITLHGFGGFAMSSGARTPTQALVISLAGPAVTFAIGLIALGIGNFGLGMDPLSIQFFLIRYIGALNILLGFLNLVPSFPFDGGNALAAILNRRHNEYKAMRMVGHIGLVVTPPIMLYGWFTNAGYMALFGLMGFITSLMTLTQSGGIRFGEGLADRKVKQEEQRSAKATEKREQAYYDDVRRREQDRAERERLRKMFESSLNDDSEK
jgi:Zn-dependent protease